VLLILTPFTLMLFTAVRFIVTVLPLIIFSLVAFSGIIAAAPRRSRSAAMAVATALVTSCW
jgi:hypothetical protein